MKCEHAEDLLSDYIDQVLNTEEKTSVEAHLEDCADCRRNLEELRWITELMHAVPQEPVPAGLSGRIHAALAALPDEAAETPAVAQVVDFNQKRQERETKDTKETKEVKGGGGGWRKWFNAPSALGGAAVAAAVLLTVVNLQNQTLPRLETAAVTVQEDVALNIGFDVAQSVEDVTFQIDLPEGLQFVDDNRQPMLAQSVAWKGSLVEGKTVIPIVVRGVRPGRYEIQAFVRKGPMMRKETIVLPVNAS